MDGTAPAAAAGTGNRPRLPGAGQGNGLRHASFSLRYSGFIHPRLTRGAVNGMELVSRWIDCTACETPHRDTELRHGHAGKAMSIYLH